MLESERFLSLNASGENQGYIKQPIVDFIDFNLVIVDMLHLYLRITDKFFEILITKLAEKDGVGSLSKSLDQRPNFKKLFNFLEQQCNITKPFYSSEKEQHKYKLRSLNGNERAIFLQKISDYKIKTLFPALDNNTALVIYYVFKDFKETVDSIKKNEYNDTNIEELRGKLKTWLNYYVKLIPANSKEITPYIHCYVFHLPEFILKFKEINLYNLQGLEKLNDFSTQIYHSATNKHKINKSFIIQMIRKRNRMEYYNLKGTETEINH